MKSLIKRSAIDRKEYERLELITPEQRTLKQKLQQFWQVLVADLKGSSEPRLWQTTDRNGQTWWNGYDPTTGRSVRRLSESNMLIWLEQRYATHTEFDLPLRPRLRRSSYDLRR